MGEYRNIGETGQIAPKGRRISLPRLRNDWNEYSKSKPGGEWVKCIKYDDRTLDACASKPLITFCCEKCSS